MGVLLTAVLSVAVVLTWSLLQWVWFNPKRLERQLRALGFRGSPYRFLVGDMNDLIRMREEAMLAPISLGQDISSRIYPFYHSALRNHGKNCFMWFGMKPRLIITDPDEVKQITNQIDDFRKLRLNPLAKNLFCGLVGHEGDKWAKHRKLLNPAFRTEKLKLMIPAFHQSCDGILSKWERLISDKESVEVDVWPDLKVLTSDAISRTAFGSSYQEGQKIFEILCELLSLSIRAQLSIYIPGSRFLPTKLVRKMRSIDAEMRTSIISIIAKRETLIAAGEPAGDDLLGVLMDSNYREIQEQGVGMSYDDMIQECMLFYGAGQETTSSLLVWTMILLAKHSDWQERARTEVQQVIGNKMPDSDALAHLQVVSMILNESLRLYPPGAVILRSTYKEVNLGNIRLPKGVEIIVPVAMIHYDQELWGNDAHQFNPERFADGISKATNNQLSFLPFSWGPRICLGQNFALMEAKIVMAMILHRFSFALSSSYAHAPSLGATVQPQHGAYLLLQKL